VEGPLGDHAFECFEPSAAQLRAQTALDGKSYGILVCHRGFGKTVLAVNALILGAVQGPASARYAYIAPYLKQAKEIAWDALRGYGGGIGGTRFSESELRCEIAPDRRIRLFGADNAEALRGNHLDGVVFDEYATINPQVWSQIILPALSRRQGWALFIGTPKGHNHFHQLYESARRDDTWAVVLEPASTSGVFTPEELARFQRGMDPDEYRQEYECSFEAAIRGAYYATQIEAARAAGRVRQVPLDPTAVVDTYWDLGWDDATAIIFAQTIGRELHIVDYLEARHESLGYYAAELDRRQRAGRYVYGWHHLPHDANKTELGSGKSMREQLRTLGLQQLRVVPQAEVEEGIQAARALFPRVWFDETRAALLVDHLSAYRQEWIERTQTYGSKPRHDEHSHGADAFRYLAMAREFREPARQQQYATTHFDPIRDRHQDPARRYAGSAQRFATTRTRGR